MRLANAVRLILILTTGVALWTWLGSLEQTAQARDVRFAGASQTASPHFPVEVLGPAGITRTIQLQAPAGASASALWLQVHGLTYQDKASVRVNASNWITLNNSSVSVDPVEARYGGIGGVFLTLKMSVTLPAGAAVNGPNLIELRFNFTDGESMGYRVLNANLLDASGNRLVALVSGTQKPLPEEDPALWMPPLNSPADITAGGTLWRARNIMIESPLSTAPVVASCADCHSATGYDLKYFNFSNDSIVGRSVFHGLSETQGKKIASFIRSLQTESPGRPWNPPYQPGPGMEAKPVSDWAAGAGIDAVLSDDDSTRQYLPGAGADASAIRDGARFKEFNVRDIPVAFQLLDWNHWLPLVHPLDSAQGASFLTSDINLGYEKIRQGLDGQLGMSRDAYIYNQLRRDLDAWRDTFDVGRSGSWFNILGPAAGAPWTRAQVKQKYAAAVWAASKQFEIMHEFELEEKGRELYGMAGESRQWFSNRHIFSISPHLMGMSEQPFPLLGDGSATLTSPPGCGYGPLAQCGRARRSAVYLANAWYYLQLILNPGAHNAVTGGWDTMDWDYTRGLMGTLYWETEHPSLGRQQQDMRGLVLAYKGMEQADNGYGPDGRGAGSSSAPWWGWDLRDNAAWLANTVFPDGESAVVRATAKRTLYQVWLEKSGTYSQQQWQAGLYPRSLVGNLSAPPPTYTIPNWASPAMDYEDFASLLAFNTRYVRARMTGVEDALSNGMADLGATIWPDNPWSELKRHGAQAAPAELQAQPGVESVRLTWSPALGATSYNVKRGDSAAGPFRAVQLFVNGTTWTERDLAAGRAYFYRVSANVGLSETLDSTVVVSATPVTGLVGYWSFDESVGMQAGDSASTSNHATLLGARRVAGVRGMALNVGQGAYAGVRRNLRWLSGDFTLTAWVSTTLSGSADVARMPALAGSTGKDELNPVLARRTLIGALNQSGAIGMHIGLDEKVFSGVAVNDGQWHHVAFTRDQLSGQVKIYVDGVLSASGTLTTTYLWQRALGFGRPEQPTLDNYWQGGLDEVRIYNRPLTSDEISSIYGGSAAEAPVLPDVPFGGARYGVPYSMAVSATGSPTPVVSVLGLPPGLTFANGVVTGTPRSAGTYSVTVSAANGVGPTATREAQLIVAQAPLTVTAVSVTRPFGIANPVLSVAYSGWVNGDTVAMLTGSPQIGTNASGGSPPGAYAITVSAGTLSSANYVFTYVGGTLTIEGAPQPPKLPARAYLVLVTR